MRYLVSGYLAIAMVFWFFLANWGALAYKGAAYNFGRALVWPTVIFPSLGQLIGGILIVGFIVFLTFFVRSK